MKKAINLYFYGGDTKAEIKYKNSSIPMEEILKQNLNSLNILDAEIQKLRVN